MFIPLKDRNTLTFPDTNGYDEMLNRLLILKGFVLGTGNNDTNIINKIHMIYNYIIDINNELLIAKQTSETGTDGKTDQTADNSKNKSG